LAASCLAPKYAPDRTVETHRRCELEDGSWNTRRALDLGGDVWVRDVPRDAPDARGSDVLARLEVSRLANFSPGISPGRAARHDRDRFRAVGVEGATPTQNVVPVARRAGRGHAQRHHMRTWIPQRGVHQLGNRHTMRRVARLARPGAGTGRRDDVLAAGGNGPRCTSPTVDAGRSSNSARYHDRGAAPRHWICSMILSCNRRALCSLSCWRPEPTLRWHGGRRPRLAAHGDGPEVVSCSAGRGR
jgi:hypothetical protein